MNTSEKIARIKTLKRGHLAVLTAADFPTAKLIDECGVPVILVGDSLGMVALGYPNTTHVTMADMQHHIRAVARAKPNALIIGDMPYKSYEHAAEAVRNARLLLDAGAEAVKAEGGREILPQVEALAAAGIPFCGHLGMLPQHILEEGRYRIKGREDAERLALIEDAKALEDAGAFAMVLELVTPPVAREMTDAVNVPTIGIGSGPDCDGQVLVTHDLLGTFPWFTPRFVKPKVNAAEQFRAAIRDWMQTV